MMAVKERWVKARPCDMERSNRCRGGLIDGGVYMVKADGEKIYLCYHCLHRLLDDAERNGPAPSWPAIAINPGVWVYGPIWNMEDLVVGWKAPYTLPPEERWQPPETIWIWEQEDVE